MLRFFYSFTASDGSEESIADCVVSPCSIMMHHVFRNKEARRERKQKYQLRQAISHSSLLVARQGDVSRKLNQAFLLVDSFNFNFVDVERSDICLRLKWSIYISYVRPTILYVSEVRFLQQSEMGWGYIILRMYMSVYRR